MRMRRPSMHHRLEMTEACSQSQMTIMARLQRKLGRQAAAKAQRRPAGTLVEKFLTVALRVVAGSSSMSRELARPAGQARHCA